MAIYNRWGQIMYETDDAENGWNGSKAGKDCAIGLYVYVVTYES
jgi:gliding motility-associated-like protein